MKDDIKVSIVDDCSTIDYSGLLEMFNKILDINYVKLKENHGVGYCRNYLLDNSECPYLVFCDSDDVFYNMYSIYMLYENIVANKSDFITGKFICEDRDKINTIFLSKVPNNCTWVYSRIYCREFILLNKIRFADVRMNEDVPFISTVFACSKKNEEIDNIIYVWKCNKNSLTRKEKDSVDKILNSKLTFIKGLIFTHIQKRKLGVIDNEISKRQICDGINVSYWYFIELLSLMDTSRVEKYLDKFQIFYNLCVEDYPKMVETDEFKNSYFSVLKQLDGITNLLIPRVTIWDLLSEFEENRKIVKIDCNCKYQFG